MDAKNIIEKYKLLVSLQPEDLTDEEIESICNIECDMKQLTDALIWEHKIYRERARIADKQSEYIKKIINYCMRKQWLDVFAWENWKVSSSKAWKRDLDMNNVPEEFKSVNYQTINSKLNKWETIPWITPTQAFISYTVR